MEPGLQRLVPRLTHRIRQLDEVAVQASRHEDDQRSRPLRAGLSRMVIPAPSPFTEQDPLATDLSASVPSLRV